MTADKSNAHAGAHPARTGELPVADLVGLQRRLSGQVLTPDSPGYEAARKPPVARFQHRRPRAIVRCATAADVAETLDLARRAGVRVAVRSGGHCLAGRSTTDGIVLDLTSMHEVAVSGATATVGAGTRLGQLYDRLHEHDVALPAGCGETVGIAGLTLGGGIGILGRKYGLTCDRLRGANVVLADGQVVDCDDGHYPDLFWALRGAGGGQFGVVTSLVFHVVPAPTATAFELTWPSDDAAAVISAWQTWAPDAPDEVNASLRLIVAGDSPPPTVSMVGAVLADEADTMTALGQLVVACNAEPSSVSLAESSYRQVKRTLAGDDAEPGSGPVQPQPMRHKSEFFRRSLPMSVIAELLHTLTSNRSADQSRELAFTPLGGAYGRVPVPATAFAHRQERFLLEHISTLDAGVAPASQAPAAEADAKAWTMRSWAVAHPWSSGSVYPNFPDPDLADWASAYHGSNYARLLAVKRSYDPDNVFSFEQSLRA